MIAAGGIGGNLELVRREWPTAELGRAPRNLLMGSHPLRRRRAARGGRAPRRQCHPPLADVELRRRRAPPGAPARAPRGQADPAALRRDARPRRPPLRPRSGDADLRRLRRPGAHVRGRAQVLVAGLQLEDRQARAGRLGLPAQPPPARAPPRALPAERAARQAAHRRALPGGLPGLRPRGLARGAGAEDERGERGRRDRPRAARCRDRPLRRVDRPRQDRSSTTTSCGASPSCAAGAGTGCAPARSSGSWTPRRCR